MTKPRRIRSEKARRKIALHELQKAEHALTEHRSGLLMLEVMRHAPFAVWAATKDCKIILWSEGAVRLYGFTEAEAVGQDFVELFVDVPEQAQARLDCAAIVERGVVFSNFLAYDCAKDKRRCTMLTNCFRVFDPERETYVQVEIGLEISDLETSKERHHTLREYGQQCIALEVHSVEITRRELLLRMSLANKTHLERVERERDEFSSWLRQLEADGGERARVEALGSKRISELQHRIIATNARHNELCQQLLACKDSETLRAMESSVTGFELHAPVDAGEEGT